MQIEFFFPTCVQNFQTFELDEAKINDEMTMIS